MQNGYKFFGLLIFLFGPQISFGMQEMRPIVTWQDADSFKGKVVVFSADSYYYSEGKEGYVIDQEGNLRAGFVSQKVQKWRGNTKGYELYRVAKKDIVHSICALCDGSLENANLKMRQATLEERVKILEGLNAGTVEPERMTEQLQERFREELKK